MDPAAIGVTQASSAADKIRLFQALFKGRTDVYARRFESRRTGKSGYQPACAHEWVRGLCPKAETKRARCTQCTYLPVTEQVIRQHLSGKDTTGRPFVMGLYPMLLDETCQVLVIDFDKTTWWEDASHVTATSTEMGLPVAMERSRSGAGAHLWFFFDEPVSAALARQLGTYLLTLAMKKRPDIGLDSYDRLFPSQDTLPKGGFGNLIALPLQKAARQNGNAVFIDESGVPYEDQWKFLSSIQKISRQDIDRVLHGVRSRYDAIEIAWAGEEDDFFTSPLSSLKKSRKARGSLPSSLNLILSNDIYIAQRKRPPALRNQMIRLAAFQNQEFYKQQAMRLPTYGIPRVISCARQNQRFIGLPRGCLEELQQLLSNNDIKVRTRDIRNHGQPIDATFHGTLRPDQKHAADLLAKHDTGILSATTAFGKTVVAAELIARRGVNTLILVHRRQLLEQWVERLSHFLQVPLSSLGKIGGGKRKPTGRIDVALVQSLIRKGVVQDLVETYGHLVVDECHHISAFSMEQVCRRAKARYVLGITATVARKDGHHPIIMMQCGPVRHRVHAKQQAATRPFDHHVWVRPTSFQPLEASDDDQRIQFHHLYAALMADARRNQQICDDVSTVVKEGRSPLIITERTEHVEILRGMLEGCVDHLVVLQGGLGQKDLRARMTRLNAIPESESRIILATGRYIGEGFDDARLDTLFLTLPVSWRGTIAQYAGRLHRLHEQKREVRIYDYADLNVPMLARMFDRRCKGYEQVGYTILLPASALPGWPVEVPLPIDPAWKKDYARSIQRLLRDGLDVPLANLFVVAAQTFPPDAKGIERARSASEAFLFRRLESLTETTGRFHLNAEIPIPFNQRSGMEVDFLCASAKLAVELDGEQHLHDPAAYRTDRRKDVLLQENGYFVLRFLAEDVSKRLDEVLDGIVRALSHQSRKHPQAP